MYKPKKKICVICGNTLEGKQKKYCSENCSKKGWYQRNTSVAAERQRASRKLKKPKVYSYRVTIKYHRELSEKYITHLKRHIWEYIGDIPIDNIEFVPIYNKREEKEL